MSNTIRYNYWSISYSSKAFRAAIYICVPTIIVILVGLTVFFFQKHTVQAELYPMIISDLPLYQHSATVALHPGYIPQSVPNGPLKIGTATGSFLNDLTSVEIGSNPIKAITRSPMRVAGALISINGDTAETFEYGSEQDASTDVTLLAAMYPKKKMSSSWNDYVHIYQKGTLVVFYLGANKDILVALGTTLGQSIVNK